MFSFKTPIHAAVSAVHNFTTNLIASPEFKAFETAATPVAETALTVALATKIGPAAAPVADLAVSGVEAAVNKLGEGAVAPASNTVAGAAETEALNLAELEGLPAAEKAIDKGA